MLARAKNGTGKTAAFVIPVLEKLDVSKHYIQGMESAEGNTRMMQSHVRRTDMHNAPLAGDHTTSVGECRDGSATVWPRRDLTLMISL